MRTLRSKKSLHFSLSCRTYPKRREEVPGSPAHGRSGSSPGFRDGEVANPGKGSSRGESAGSRSQPRLLSPLSGWDRQGKPQLISHGFVLSWKASGVSLPPEINPPGKISLHHKNRPQNWNCPSEPYSRGGLRALLGVTASHLLHV